LPTAPTTFRMARAGSRKPARASPLPPRRRNGSACRAPWLARALRSNNVTSGT
jgi:hypothetical protein